MELKKCLTDLGKGVVENGYIFYGEEEYLKEQALKQIRKLLLAPGMELVDEQVTEETSPSIRDLKAMIGMPPLLSRRRLILIKDDPRFRSRSGMRRDSGEDRAEDEESAGKFGKTEKTELQDALEHVGELCTLIFYNRGSIAAGPWMKLLSSRLQEVAFKPLSETEAAPWVRRMARQAGLTLVSGTAEYLFEYVGGLLKPLESEIAKLAAYCGDNPVDRDTVRDVCVQSVEYRLFDMIDALLSGRSSQAIENYYAMMAAGEEPLHLLAVIAGQLRARARAREAFNAGISVSDIAEALGTKPFVIERTLRQPKNQKVDWGKTVEWCSDTDNAVKTGRLQPDVAVEMFFLNLVQEISG